MPQTQLSAGGIDVGPFALADRDRDARRVEDFDELLNAALAGPFKGQLGDLKLDPKLMSQQFDADGRASVLTQFAGRKLKVTVHNPGHLPWGEYTIGEIRLDGRPVHCEYQVQAAILPRGTITSLAAEGVHTLDLFLAASAQQ